MNRELVKCPGCDLQLPAGALNTQRRHMESEHPELIAKRLEDAGFEQLPGGGWRDTLVGADS
jgi:hypothetical protein